MDFSLFFEEPIKEIIELSPGYDNHASDVWLVKTDKQEVVIRTSRILKNQIMIFGGVVKEFSG